MAFKSILVGLAPTAARHSGAEFSISLAKGFGGQLTACIYALHPDFRSSRLWRPGDALPAHLSVVVKEAQDAIEAFRRRAKEEDIDVTCQVVVASLDTAPTAFARQGRVFDITVVTQPGLDIWHAGDLFAEAALLESGRPLLLVPKQHTAALCTERILVAWDGSQHAARAVHDALPLLLVADRVALLVVGDSTKISETHAEAMAANLEQHAVPVELLCRHEDDELRAILKEIQAFDASLLVMGGYGHLRTREALLGGVTLHMMNNTPLPVLMCH